MPYSPQPDFQQDFLQSSGSGGAGGSTKVSLCTARFTENGKSLNCPDVAVPLPLPDELRATPDESNKSNKSNRRDRAMPFGEKGGIMNNCLQVDFKHLLSTSRLK